MKALWHFNPDASGTQTEELPIPDRKQLHVRSLFSLISTGTELLIARGHVPQEMHAHMRVPNMAGEFFFPVKYGYSLVGKISETGAIGHVMHPHQNECLVNADEVFEVPMDIPPKRAILASNLETALTGIWDGSVRPGERIVIVGFGMIGSLIARIAANMPGTHVEIVETNAVRKGYAEQFGFTLLEAPSGAVEPFDVAFHTSGTQQGLQQAIELVGLEGRVVEMSWYGSTPVTINLGGEFHVLRKQLISSQVSRIPAQMTNRWDHHRRKKTVFDLLRDPAYDQHITHEITLEEAAELFNTWRINAPTGLGYCIRY